MHVQDAWVPTHTNEIYHICHVISFTRPSSPLFYFLGGRGWPGEEATLDMSLFLARVEVNLVGRCFLLTSTAADNGSDRNWVFASSGQSSLASGSIIPSWCIVCPLSYRLFYLRCGVGIVQSLESLFYHNARTFVGTFDDQGLVFTKLLKGLLCAGVRFEGVQRVNLCSFFRHPSIAGEAGCWRYPGALF